ncbi:MAG: DUF427 domain-containing protein [Myxococcota bacterium]
MARSEAYDRHPEHALRFEDAPAAIRVYVGDALVAETRRGLTLRESRSLPVVYVPREDVRMDRLDRVAHTTHCPFKGDATYFDVIGDARSEKVAWSYEDPFDQMEALRDHLAFYPDRARVEPLEG